MRKHGIDITVIRRSEETSQGKNCENKYIYSTTRLYLCILWRLCTPVLLYFIGKHFTPQHLDSEFPSFFPRLSPLPSFLLIYLHLFLSYPHHVPLFLLIFELLFLLPPFLDRLLPFITSSLPPSLDPSFIPISPLGPIDLSSFPTNFSLLQPTFLPSSQLIR